MTNPAVKADAIKQLDFVASLAGMTTYTDLQQLSVGLLAFMASVHNNWHQRHAPGESQEQFNKRRDAIAAAQRIIKDATP